MPQLTAALRPEIAALLLATLSGCGGASGTTVDPPAGDWRAWLDSPGGELPFGLSIVADGSGGYQAALINGSETIPLPRLTLSGDRVEISIDHYDSLIQATLSPDGTRLDGVWRKTAGPDVQARLEFHATRGAAPRFRSADRGGADAAAVAGRWSVRFAESDDPAVGIFEAAADGTVTGTFLTTTGDYRFLAGAAIDGRLLLSCFDGAHAFLFDARLLDDGTLAGDFWSRDSWHETWTAKRDPDAALPDAFAQTTWVEDADLATAVFPGLDGDRVSLADPAFAGKARIIEIFGTWCPNCNDATSHLVELDQRYGDRGLSIVGLAFEMTGDFRRDADQVRKYVDYKNIRYPILVAGLSDKARASEAFPLIDRIRSFPTTVFLHADGRVRAVYSGYSGPATGPAHDELRRRWEALIEELLAG